MTSLSAFLAGLVFGLGLIISGMANPGKVLGFLDITGRWDPSLGLVMASALAVGTPAFALAGKRSRTLLLGISLQLPTARTIDKRLIAGSAVFGIGWGLAGFCPGPALVGIGLLQPKALAFAIAMLVGMLGFEWMERRHTLLSAPTLPARR